MKTVSYEVSEILKHIKYSRLIILFWMVVIPWKFMWKCKKKKKYDRPTQNFNFSPGGQTNNLFFWPYCILFYKSWNHFCI